jgi:hypothetical protein
MLRPGTCRTSSPLCPTPSPRPASHPPYRRHSHCPRSVHLNTQASKTTMPPSMHVLRLRLLRASYHHLRLTRSRRDNGLLHLSASFLFLWVRLFSDLDDTPALLFAIFSSTQRLSCYDHLSEPSLYLRLYRYSRQVRCHAHSFSAGFGQCWANIYVDVLSSSDSGCVHICPRRRV